MGNHSQVSLSPQVFRKMLTLPDPTTTFKGENCRQFLKKHGNELDLLPKFLQNPTGTPRDIAIIQVSAFKNLFRQIAWIFTRITRQESAANISQMILYILYFTVKEEAIFHCRKLISIEISSQLLQYRRQKKFFMSSYLIFAVANCYPFPGLSMCKKLNYEFDPCHISGTMFFAGIARQYIYWLHFSHEKRKSQFISLPWKVGDFMVRHHFNSSFTDTILNELGASTNDSPKHKGKGPGEKSAQSPTATPKTTTSRRSTPTAYPSNKVTHSSSGGGGDKNPPSGKIESCHKLPAIKKWKTIVQEQEVPRGEIDIHDLSLEDMELEIDIDKVFPDDNQLESTAPHNPGMEIIGIDTLDEEESFAFQSVVFDSESKKLIIEKKDVKNKKGKSRSEINL
jgi:hypothetical protein